MISTLRKSILTMMLLSLAALSAAAQDKDKGKKESSGPLTNPVMWQDVNQASLDLFNGPGGTEMQPDVSRVEFIKEEKQGHNKKFRIKDAKGQVWVAKPGREAQPETA